MKSRLQTERQIDLLTWFLQITLLDAKYGRLDWNLFSPALQSFWRTNNGMSSSTHTCGKNTEQMQKQLAADLVRVSQAWTTAV